MEELDLNSGRLTQEPTFFTSVDKERNPTCLDGTQMTEAWETLFE